MTDSAGAVIGLGLRPVVEIMTINFILLAIDQVTIATTMTLTLSIDHRAVDGATAAGFLTRLKELIEEPLDIVL